MFKNIISRETFGLDALRLVLCAILFTHGAYRFYEGSVPVLGEILGKIGFPAGVCIGPVNTIVVERVVA
jgi:putative oxidoreductase